MSLTKRWLEEHQFEEEARAKLELYKFAYETHDHDPEGCDICYDLVQVGFLEDKYPEPEDFEEQGEDNG